MPAPETFRWRVYCHPGQCPVGESIADQVQQGQPVSQEIIPRRTTHDHLAVTNVRREVSMPRRVVSEHER